MIDGMLAGLSLVLSWPTFGFLLLGVFIGLWVGAVPGLGDDGKSFELANPTDQSSTDLL